MERPVEGIDLLTDYIAHYQWATPSLGWD